MANINSEEIQTEPFVAWYPYLDTMRVDKENPGKKTWDVGAIFDIATQKAAIDRLLIIEDQARKLNFPTSQGFAGLQRSVKYPKPEDIEKFPEHLTGKIIFTFRTYNNPPGVGAFEPTTGKVRPVQQGEGIFYTGCICVAKVVAYGFQKPVNKGVAFGLNNVFKLADGTAFGGGAVAADVAFKDFDPSQYQHLLHNESLFNQGSGPSLPGLPSVPGV